MGRRGIDLSDSYRKPRSFDDHTQQVATAANVGVSCLLSRPRFAICAAVALWPFVASRGFWFWEFWGVIGARLVPICAYVQWRSCLAG